MGSHFQVDQAEGETELAEATCQGTKQPWGCSSLGCSLCSPCHGRLSISQAKGSLIMTEYFTCITLFIPHLIDEKTETRGHDIHT